MLGRHASLWLMLLCCCLPATAADPQLLYQQSTDALYNLDFNTAQQGYETLTREYSDNPDYWNAWASAIWLRILYDQQKLNMDSFSGSALKGSGDTVNPAEERRLREIVATAIAKADALLKKNPKNVRALYAKGISNATLASFEASAKRSYLSAGRKAKAARDLHEEVLKLDPTFNDAYLSVGIFNYVVGVVPGLLRLTVLQVLGLRSAGKELGIEQIETAAAKGKTTSTDARMLLIVVYNREKRYEQSLQMVNELHGRYQRNFMFELAKASVYAKMKRWDDAARTYEHILGKLESKKDGYERLAAHKVHYALGTSNIERHQFETALGDFSRVAKSKDAPANDKAGALLWMGKIYDSSGRRAEALKQYDAILALNCDRDFKSQAQQYKRKAYK
jgi:tetratricopeptide (TPR) repeat protein